MVRKAQRAFGNGGEGYAVGAQTRLRPLKGLFITGAIR